MSSDFKSKITKQRVQIFLGQYFRLVILIMVILIFFGGWFFLKPKYQQIISLTESQKRKVRSDFEGRKIYLNKLISTINAYNQIDKSDIAKVNAILPPPNIKETLFPYMDNLMRKNGFLLTSLSVQPIMEESGSAKKKSDSGQAKKDKQVQGDALPKEIGVIKMNMSIAGVDYESLKRLLRIMENNLRLMDISDLGFDLNNETATLALTTYYYNNNLSSQPEEPENKPEEPENSKE